MFALVVYEVREDETCTDESAKKTEEAPPEVLSTRDQSGTVDRC